MNTSLLSTLLLFSFMASAATAPQNTKSPGSAQYGTSSETPQHMRKSKKEPSAIPCPPQKTRDEKLDDLAKLEGQGESHSTNCPAQGAIKDDGKPLKDTQ